MGLGEVLGGFAGEAKKLPPWAWILIAGLGGGALLYLHNQAGSSKTTQDPGAQGTSTAATDMTGGVTAAPVGTTGQNVVSTPQGQPVSSNGFPIGPPPRNPTTLPRSPTQQHSGKPYTIQQGDTLADIGYAKGKNWQTIYANNESTIEATAKQHGFASSDDGHWIFPGEVIYI